jgi:hypothetical protein
LAPFVLVLALAACGDDGAASTAPDAVANGETACVPGELPLGDGRCIAAGSSPDGCEAGERWVDGACRGAGIPAGACAEGFVHDGARGCDPVLPGEACLAGEIAVPGDTACRPLGSCGSGAFGDIAAEPDTQHVDAGYSGGSSDGSSARPWTTIQQAVDAAGDGAIVAVAAGSYAEQVKVVDRAIRLWGRCASMVEIVGDDSAAALAFDAGASGSSVRGLSMRGAAEGLSVAAATAVTVDESWIHDTDGYGVRVVGTGSSLTLSDSLLEATAGRGIYVEGGHAAVDRCAVRDTRVGAGENGGRGINVRDGDGVRGSLQLSRSLIEKSREVGVMVHQSDADIDGTVVRHILPSATGRFGRCFSVQAVGSAQPSVASIRRSAAIGCSDGGISVTVSEVSVEHTVVRDVAAAFDSGIRGYGIVAQHEPNSVSGSKLTVRESLVERAHEMGVFVAASEATLEGLAVIDSLPLADGTSGRGIGVQSDPSTGVASVVELRGVVVERCSEVAVMVEGGSAVIEGLRVFGVLENRDGNYGRGVNIQANPFDEAPADITLRAVAIDGFRDVAVFLEKSTMLAESVSVRGGVPNSRLGIARGLTIQGVPAHRAHATVRGITVDDAVEAGVENFSSDLELSYALVRGTLPSASGDSVLAEADLFGDALVLISEGEGATATIEHNTFTGSARAGVLLFGAEVAMTDTAIACNAMDLVGQEYLARNYRVDNRSGNRCGCDDLSLACKLVTADFKPPAAPTDL